jgi:Malectin domain
MRFHLLTFSVCAEFSLTAPGQRIFDVNVEGTAVDDLDLVQIGGQANKAITRLVTVAVNDGQLSIIFIPQVILTLLFLFLIVGNSQLTSNTDRQCQDLGHRGIATERSRSSTLGTCTRTSTCTRICTRICTRASTRASTCASTRASTRTNRSAHAYEH